MARDDSVAHRASVSLDSAPGKHELCKSRDQIKRELGFFPIPGKEDVSTFVNYMEYANIR